MRRFYLPPEQLRGGNIVLSGRESHHALNVLRMRVGEAVIVLDGVGGEYRCEVSGVERHAVLLRLLEKKETPPQACQITLVQSIPKGKTMDTIVQKAAELGAYRVVPVLSERTVSQVDDDGAAHKVEKWHATAIEAIKQCGSPWLPRVEMPVSLAEFLARKETFDLSLMAALQGDTQPPRRYFEAYVGEHQKVPHTVCVWVGPEGDFTPDEVAAIRGNGALPITLGPLVLRSDTAAIYCLSVVNYELQSAR